MNIDKDAAEVHVVVVDAPYGRDVMVSHDLDGLTNYLIERMQVVLKDCEYLDQVEFPDDFDSLVSACADCEIWVYLDTGCYPMTFNEENKP